MAPSAAPSAPSAPVAGGSPFMSSMRFVKKSVKKQGREARRCSFSWVKSVSRLRFWSDSPGTRQTVHLQGSPKFGQRPRSRTMTSICSSAERLKGVERRGRSTERLICSCDGLVFLRFLMKAVQARESSDSKETHGAHVGSRPCATFRSG